MAAVQLCYSDEGRIGKIWDMIVLIAPVCIVHLLKWQGLHLAPVCAPVQLLQSIHMDAVLDDCRPAVM